MFVKQFSPSTLRGLFRSGYIIIDAACPLRLAHNALSELKALHEFGVMYPCHTHVLSNDRQTRLMPKRNVLELELHCNRELRAVCPDMFRVMEDKSLCAALNALDAKRHEFSHQTLKALYSEHKGCFPVHLDSDADPDSDLRRVTAILYLNEQRVDGGELRLFPLTRGPLNIAPNFNRVVLFSSRFMLHRTLPCVQPRYALNLWLHIRPAARRKEAAAERPESVQQRLATPKYLKCIAKVLYDAEWRQSIVASHQSEQDIQWLLEAHAKDISICKRVLAGIVPDIVRKRQIHDHLHGDGWQDCEIDWMC